MKKPLTTSMVKGTDVFFTQYYGNISVRLYDQTKRKNVAKIELSDLTQYITRKIRKGQFKVDFSPKGNAYPIVTLK